MEIQHVCSDNQKVELLLNFPIRIVDGELQPPTCVAREWKQCVESVAVADWDVLDVVAIGSGRTRTCLA